MRIGDIRIKINEVTWVLKNLEN